MKAYELLDSPEKWTKGASARDKHGNPIVDEVRTPVCWCTLGAMACVYPSFNEYKKSYDRLRDTLATKMIGSWNDAPERTFEEVRAALIKADV